MYVCNYLQPNPWLFGHLSFQVESYSTTSPKENKRKQHIYKLGAPKNPGNRRSTRVFDLKSQAKYDWCSEVRSGSQKVGFLNSTALSTCCDISLARSVASLLCSDRNPPWRPKALLLSRVGSGSPKVGQDRLNSGGRSGSCTR